MTSSPEAHTTCQCGHQYAWHFEPRGDRHPCEVCSCRDFTPQATEQP